LWNTQCFLPKVKFFEEKFMARRIESTESDTIINFLKKRMPKGDHVGDIIYCTKPDKDAPINIWESARISNVQFFNNRADAVVSSTANKDIALVVVQAAYGGCVWVREESTNLLTNPRWATFQRIRAIEHAYKTEANSPNRRASQTPLSGLFYFQKILNSKKLCDS
jgi:hypothetical protein